MRDSHSRPPRSPRCGVFGTSVRPQGQWWYNTDMDGDIYDDLAIEAAAREEFGRQLDIKQVIARSIPTSHTTQASVFVTTKNHLYVLIRGRSPLTLGDVRKMIKRMGMVAEAYVPPRHQPDYFDAIAEAKFREVFPGRRPSNEGDLRFYRLLAPYNPALVLISEVSDGVIRQFDAADSSNWRAAAKYAYRRIKAK